MNRYILIHRLTGPAILLLVGILALLSNAHLIRFWALFVPLLLILIGVLKLAERLALAAGGDEPPYPGAYPGVSYPYAGAVNAAVPEAGSAHAAAHPDAATAAAPPQDFGKDSEGGQS
ncbi:MAG: hypothetical protein WBM14_17775 [Terracidiphilus sp.]